LPNFIRNLNMNISTLKENLVKEDVVNLYKANKWSAVDKPERLFN